MDERDVGRLLTFVGDHGVAGLLAEHADDLFGFALSVAVIARLWVAQHPIVRPLVRQSTTVLWLPLGWAFTIVSLPFPIGVVAGSPAGPLADLLPPSARWP